MVTKNRPFATIGLAWALVFLIPTHASAQLYPAGKPMLVTCGFGSEGGESPVLPQPRAAVSQSLLVRYDCGTWLGLFCVVSDFLAA
jgi:hypothetical protein